MKIIFILTEGLFEEMINLLNVLECKLVLFYKENNLDDLFLKNNLRISLFFLFIVVVGNETLVKRANQVFQFCFLFRTNMTVLSPNM